MNKEPSENKATKTEAPATVFKYVGNGEHFVGVPPRDLTKDEFDALSDEQKEYVAKGGSYRKGK